MRLWHYEMISILPKNILIKLWHDCEAIGSNLERKGTTGDVKCDRILDYNYCTFEEYCTRVHNTMILRHYKINNRLGQLLFARIKANADKFHPSDIVTVGVYKNWHNLDYFDLCYKLIKELHDCNVVKDDDWFGFNDGYHHKRIEYVSRMLSRPATDSIVHDRDRYDAITDSVSAIRRSQGGLYIDATDPSVGSYSISADSIQSGSLSILPDSIPTVSLSISADSIPSGITLSATDTTISASSPTEIPF